jgi:hypothetical protein
VQQIHQARPNPAGRLGKHAVKLKNHASQTYQQWMDTPIILGWLLAELDLERPNQAQQHDV